MTRRYCQVERARSARKTRDRIIAAARERVLADGYRAVSVEDVAQAAGVARASVFRHFTCKAEILRAVEADAAQRAGVDRLIAALGTLGPRATLFTAIREGTRIWAAEARVFQEFYGTAPFDETLRPLVIEKEARRRLLVRTLVARLHDEGLLRPDCGTVDTVTDAVWLLTGFDSFDALTRVRGLSAKAAARLIEGLVRNAFLNDSEKGEENHEVQAARSHRLEGG